MVRMVSGLLSSGNIMKRTRRIMPDIPPRIYNTYSLEQGRKTLYKTLFKAECQENDFLFHPESELNKCILIFLQRSA
jgi:hypothetical protein